MWLVCVRVVLGEGGACVHLVVGACGYWCGCACMFNGVYSCVFGWVGECACVFVCARGCVLVFGIRLKLYWIETVSWWKFD